MDIAIFFDEFSRPDIRITNGDPETEGGFETAVFVSLFSDRRDGDLQDGGWWGDAFDTSPLGSRLWTLARSKMDAKLLTDAKTYCEEALQWMIDDGIAKRIIIDISQKSSTTIIIGVQIIKPDGGEAGFKWQLNWKSQETEPLSARR